MFPGKRMEEKTKVKTVGNHGVPLAASVSTAGPKKKVEKPEGTRGLRKSGRGALKLQRR